MNRLLSITITSILVLFTLCSCGGSSTNSFSDSGDTLSLSYAENIQIINYGEYSVVNLSDPWNKGKTLHTYILVPESKQLPDNLPEGTVVRTPLKRAVVATSVHCGLIIDLQKGSSIKGVCDLKYINLPWIQQQCAKGNIAECGSGLAPTLEKIIDIDADAILISPFQNNGGYGRLEELKKPIIEMADYMETSALGRAEWMKFYGMLFGAEEQANAIFKSVETDYNNLKALALTSKTRKSIVIDKKSGSVWYVPGGHSTIGRIIIDANADYPFADNDNSGSIPLPFESVFEKAGDCDLWMLRYGSPQPATLKSLVSEYQGYSQFKAFKEGEVYGCNTETSTFYEDTPFHPDMLLRDFIIIAHPDLKGLGETKYFKKLK
ncbi:MAG: ABC transporter substrate-binding protein [Prevotellaceae bacterium]|nr:ABC transporter substrate-binding protein [Prevotellaceae bacterium]